MPERSSTNAAAASTTPRLFRNDVLKGGPGKHRKNGVVEPQEGQVATWIVGERCADSADDDGDHQREEEKRQEKLTRPARRCHRREQRADGGEAEIGPRHARDKLPGDGLEEE